MAIQRVTLRNQVRDELLARMRDGRVRPGESINEVQLSAELGVSRTPLREALIALESSGQVTSVEGKGFCFLPLSSEELLDLAPILAALESLALELSDPGELRAIAVELIELAEAFTAESVPLHLLAAKDDAWHARMLSACPNRRLLDLIKNTKRAFRRYESLLLRDETMIGRTANEHVAIARFLADGDLIGAQRALTENWLHGAARVAETVPQGEMLATAN